MCVQITLAFHHNTHHQRIFDIMPSVDLMTISFIEEGSRWHMGGHIDILGQFTFSFQKQVQILGKKKDYFEI